MYLYVDAQIKITFLDRHLTEHSLATLTFFGPGIIHVSPKFTQNTRLLKSAFYLIYAKAWFSYMHYTSSRHAVATLAFTKSTKSTKIFPCSIEICSPLLQNRYNIIWGVLFSVNAHKHYIYDFKYNVDIMLLFFRLFDPKCYQFCIIMNNFLKI